MTRILMLLLTVAIFAASIALTTLGLSTHASVQPTHTIDFEQFSGPSLFTGVQSPLTVGTATVSGGQILSATAFLPANQTKVYGTSIFCPGCLPSITIDFSQPISDFSVFVANGQTFTVLYTVEDDQGGMQTLILFANLNSGAGTFTLPSTNIRRVTIRSNIADWDFFIDNITFSESGCTTNVQRLSQGGNAPWANNLYDHSSTATIRELGCALTSLSMALNFVGLANDPGSLNEFMTQTDNDYNGTSVNWGCATRDRSNGSLRFNGFRSRTTQALDDALCQGSPVIVGVNLNANGVPGHFVLVTGKQGDQYLIADPGFGGRTTLDSYNNQFETRGSVLRIGESNGSSLSGLLQSTLATAEAENISELDIAVGGNAELRVIDEMGRHTGLNNDTQMIVEDIPDSVYFRDALENDETGEAPLETGHLVEIDQPVQGTYRVDLIGVNLGTYTLSIRVFSHDGSAQPPIVIQGILGVDSTSSFQILLSLEPNAVSKVTRTVTPESALNDVRNSLALGLIDNAGIAQALSSKLEAAKAAAALGKTQTSKQILEAFKALIKAQTSKHIDAFAAQVLLEDADFLLVQ
jgi:hypothetical protein